MKYLIRYNKSKDVYIVGAGELKALKSRGENIDVIDVEKRSSTPISNFKFKRFGR